MIIIIGLKRIWKLKSAIGFCGFVSISIGVGLCGTVLDGFDSVMFGDVSNIMYDNVNVFRAC